MQRFFAVAVGLAVIAGILFYVFVYNKPHRSVENADFVVPAATLVKEFEQDEEAANRKYVDNVIEVTGEVKEILTDEQKSMIMFGGSGTFSGVSCTLQPGQDSDLQNLRSGDSIAVRGICTGRLLDVILVECKIVRE